MRTVLRELRAWFPILAWALLLVVLQAGVAMAQEDGGGASPKDENFLVWVAKTSGLIGLVILALSIYFVATVVRMFLELRESVAAPPDLLQACDDLIAQKDFKTLYTTVKASDSFLGRALATGISELPNGLPEARESMERTGDAATGEMEKMISMLAVLGTLGPMIGLLGTLKGMIASFSVIARSGVKLEADKVAEGISEALLLTFEGVALSVPAIFFFALFRNRITSISANTMLVADQLLRRLWHSAKWKAAPPTEAVQK